MRRPLTLAAALAVAAALGAPGVAAARLHLVPVGTFAQPDDLTAPPGDRHRLFVVERYGRIRVVRDRRVLRRPFLDISRDVLIANRDETKDQRGLFSMAFAPDYRRSGRFYVFYVDRADRLRVDEYRRSARDPDRADPRSRREVIDLGPAATEHHGGQLQFGPDGLLYISTGMNDTASASQDLSSLRGKLLRIDPRRSRTGAPYTVPAGNPFVTTAGARPEIYALGLRNPWRFSFDRRTGALVIGDVGENTVEEVDWVARGRGAGANFGWPIFEGNLREQPGTPAHYVAPVITHRHGRDWCAIVGGYVVRDPGLPALAGRFVYGDVCSGDLWSARLGSGRARGDRRLPLRVPYLVSFGQDARGRIYGVSLAGGVWRLAG